MKRSKMINYLAKIIATSGASNPGVDEEALAADVLSACDEQGMLPPRWKYKIGQFLT